MRRHAPALALLMLVIGGLTAAVVLLIDWFPIQAAEQAERIDHLMWYLVISSGAIYVIVISVLLYSVWRFRAKPGDESDGPPNHGNTSLEVAWTVLPAILLGVMAVWAYLVVDRNEALAADREVIEVTAWQFAWEFRYPEAGVTSGDLRVPVGRQIDLQMRSVDVIHDLWVPEWRVKHDVVPGMTNRLIVNPTRVGTYPLICMELCGVGHAAMRSRAIVMEPDDYEAWLRNAQREVREEPTPPPAERGRGEDADGGVPPPPPAITDEPDQPVIPPTGPGSAGE
ncbi:MAG TPA: cytochrome c oxidase subunit II [Miltoncostaeaceae bacterium]|jgi:cytochrome c oxidase subunit II|nr:cytochrome c oxidase subunit II [Miltoncostaeaceae bacterium]